MQTTSQVMPRPIRKWLEKSGLSKKEFAKDLNVSKQTPTDWTSGKPVTSDNAVRIAESANDTDLTMEIVWKFFRIFKPMDGDTYRRDLTSTDALRELEENERDEAKALAQRVLLKQVHKLKKSDYDLLLKFSKEQAEAVFVNIQYLNVLCDVQNMSIMDLFDYYMKDWKDAGYFGGEE